MIFITERIASLREHRHTTVKSTPNRDAVLTVTRCPRIFCFRIEDMKKILATLALAFLSLNAHALDWVTVTDTSQLQWQIGPDGKVYLMNLQQFNPAFLPCCANYYIDTSTAVGKTMWASSLANMAMGKRLIVYVADKNTPGPILYVQY
jgi:hypothetical protein